MKVAVGTRLKSAVCDTEVIVVRAPTEDVALCCGGHPLRTRDDDAPTGLVVEPGWDGGTLLGKRYTDADGAVEVLCTKPGKGALSCVGQPMREKSAKNLPASD